MDETELRGRLERLEESVSFAAREAEQLHAEVVRAFEELRRLARRIDALERRLGAVEEGPEEEQTEVK